MIWGASFNDKISLKPIASTYRNKRRKRKRKINSQLISSYFEIGDAMHSWISFVGRVKWWTRHQFFFVSFFVFAHQIENPFTYKSHILFHIFCFSVKQKREKNVCCVVRACHELIIYWFAMADTFRAKSINDIPIRKNPIFLFSYKMGMEKDKQNKHKIQFEMWKIFFNSLNKFISI